MLQDFSSKVLAKKLLVRLFFSFRSSCVCKIYNPKVKALILYYSSRAVT
jgi:hypothetical protein